MATNVLHFQRQPAAIFTDVATTRARLTAYYERLEDLTDAEDAEWHDLEARLTALQAEADGALLSMTGQPFVAWEGALS